MLLLPQIILLSTFHHVNTDTPLHAARRQRHPLVQKLWNVNSFDFKAVRHDSRHKDVLELEVSVIQSCRIQFLRQPGGEQVSRPGGEVRKHRRLVLLRRNVIFGFFVPDRLPPLRQPAVDGALLRLVLLHERQQTVDVYVHVVVGFKYKSCFRTVVVDPLEHRNRL